MSENPIRSTSQLLLMFKADTVTNIRHAPSHDNYTKDDALSRSADVHTTIRV
jgi:hypothetical protein